MGLIHPAGMLVAGLLCGMIYQGGMEFACELPNGSRHMVVVMQGLVILFCGALEYIYKPRLVRFLAPIEVSE